MFDNLNNGSAQPNLSTLVPRVEPLSSTLGSINASSFIVAIGQHEVATKPRQTIIPVKMVPKTAFFQVHKDRILRVYMLDADEQSGGKESPFLVHPELVAELAEPCVRLRNLYPAITKQGLMYLIPVAPDATDAWSTSKLTVIADARKRWVRAPANKTLGAYEISFAAASMADPDWSALPASDAELIDMAFKGRLITSMDHPQLKALRGEF